MKTNVSTDSELDQPARCAMAGTAVIVRYDLLFGEQLPIILHGDPQPGHFAIRLQPVS